MKRSTAIGRSSSPAPKPPSIADRAAEFPRRRSRGPTAPRRRLSRWRSFWYGRLSAIIEPVAAVIGAAAVVIAAPLLPYALSFAAGAMIYVVVEELIPESHRQGNVDLATVSLMAGFAVMMILDVAFG